MSIIMAIGEALFMALSMLWEILWPLILGFALSGIVQAVASHRSLVKALGGASPKNLTLATLFGIASSSCSYAAVALARSLFQKGASFTSAMVFELASTNLVIELGIILIVLMGWQFMAAEFLGGILMVLFIALIFRFTLTPRLVQMAKTRAEQGAMGRMEGHAAMDMSVSGEGSFFQKLFSSKGLTSVSNYFVMDWASVWVDIVLGLLLPVRSPHGYLSRSGRHFFSPIIPPWPRLKGRYLGHWWRSSVSSARWAMSLWQPCYGEAGLALAAWSASSLLI